ncbi:pre-mRNA-splicing factor 38A-like [Zophobas morio]|uniref:pre-mRNA-splicing factor 38A-like n=1 Tax=Zophobas morio TaxID=2755281 RepID=UPI003083A1A9
MANSVAKDVTSIHGQNPMHLVEKIVRTRIIDSLYWKEHCFALTAETFVDKAVELNHYGGHYGGSVKATPFLCLVMKLLQLQPDKEIIIEYLKNEDFKYLRMLGAIYLRLTGNALEIYQYLEPLYDDFRRVRFKNREGKFIESHVDEFIDKLMHEERVCDLILPRLMKRKSLEELGQLEPRQSAINDDFDDADLLENYQKEVIEYERKEKIAKNIKKSGYRDLDAPRESSPLRHVVSRHRWRSRSRSATREKRRRGRSKERERERARKKERRKESKTRDSEKNTRKKKKGRDRTERDRSRARRSRHGHEEAKKRSTEAPNEEPINSDEREPGEIEAGASPQRFAVSHVLRYKKPSKSASTSETRASVETKEKRRGGNSDESLSVQQTNQLRKSLGLAPLKTTT